jgi:hypothetical protein
MTEQHRLFTIRIGEVLHYIWDPIGVSDQPGARDEYDSYIPYVMGFALKNDREGLINYLYRTAAHTIGIAVPHEQNEEVADLILDWRQWCGLQVES